MNLCILNKGKNPTKCCRLFRMKVTTFYSFKFSMYNKNGLNSAFPVPLSRFLESQMRVLCHYLQRALKGIEFIEVIHQ